MRSRGTVALALVSVAAVGSTPAHAASQPAVTFNQKAGTIAGLRIDRASQARVIRKLGRPDSRESDRNNKGYHWMKYRCGATCELRLQIQGSRLRGGWALLGDGSPAKYKKVRTAAGSYLGAARATAERVERQKMISTCSTELRTTRGSFTLAVGADNRFRVNSIMLLGKKGVVLC